MVEDQRAGAVRCDAEAVCDLAWSRPWRQPTCPTAAWPSPAWSPARRRSVPRQRGSASRRACRSRGSGAGTSRSRPPGGFRGGVNFSRSWEGPSLGGGGPSSLKERKPGCRWASGPVELYGRSSFSLPYEPFCSDRDTEGAEERGQLGGDAEGGAGEDANDGGDEAADDGKTHGIPLFSWGQWGKA